MELRWQHLINQHSDINKTHEILQDEAKCEMIVVIDNFMTSSAKYADILLPDLMTVEQEDIIPNDYAGNMGYLILFNRRRRLSSSASPSTGYSAKSPDASATMCISGLPKAVPGAMAAISVRQNAGKRSALPAYDELKKWASINVKIRPLCRL